MGLGRWLDPWVRNRLFRKYVVPFVAVVSWALLTNGLLEIYFTYRESRAALGQIQREKADAAAFRIEQFVREIEHQMRWTTQPQVVAPAAALEQRKLDYIRLQKQVPPITEVAYIDGDGREQLRLSRLAMDVIGSGIDMSSDPRFRETRGDRVWYGPVYFRKESEPYMAIAIPHGPTPTAAVTAVDVNLKFIWDVVSQIRIGRLGLAYVVDGQGQLIAHPDIGLVLRKTDLSTQPHVQAARAAAGGERGEDATIAADLAGRSTLVAHTVIAPLGWIVFVEQPLVEAFAPLRGSILRTGVLMLLAVFVSVLASLALARKIARPIGALQAGAARIGGGDLAHRIDVRTRDELQDLGEQFNRMAGQLQESYATLEHKVDDRTRELSEALEQQTATAEILKVISSSPTDVQPVFEAILESATRLCAAERGVMFTYDGDAFHGVAARGLSPQAEAAFLAPPLRPAPHTGLGRMLAWNRPVQLPDIVDDEAYRQGDPWRMRTVELLGARTAAWLPLLKGDTVVGALVIYRQEVRPFTDKQIALVQTFADQAVIAIENVRLFKELQARNAALTESLDQQTATAEILRAISRSPTDVGPVVEAVVESAARLCEAQNAQIFRVQDGMMRLVARFGPVRATLEVGQARPITRASLSGRVILDAATIHVPDLLAVVDAEYGEIAAAIHREGIGTTIGLPLMREGTPIGAITAFRTEVRPFTDKQVALLKTFADQAVIAIENVRLFNQTREALQQQTATAEILRVISSSPTDVQPVFEAIVRSGVALFEGAAVAVVLPEAEQVTLAAIAEADAERAARWRGRFPFPLTREYMHGMAIVDRRLVDVPDVVVSHEIPDTARRNFLPSGYRAITIMPMLREHTAIGAISVIRPEPGPLSDKQIALLKTFADQAVIAVENVRLFKELQARNAALTTSLEQQTATSEILRVISGAQQDAQPVFETIVRSAVRLCHAMTAGVFRTDGRVLYHPANHGGSPDALEAVRARYPRPLDMQTAPGIAILTRSVFHVDDSEDPSVVEQVRTVARVLGFRSAVTVPMVREGEAVGAIVVTRREPGRFSEAEVDLLKTFADQAVIAIENVRLFRELQARNAALTESLDQQTATADILRVISSSPTAIQPVLDAVAESAARVCGATDAIIMRVEDHQMRRVAHFGAIPLVLPGTRLLTPGTLGGRAILECRPIHVHDIRDADAAREFPEAAAVSGWRTTLAVPLVREGAAIGAITIRRTDVRPFTDKQIALLKTFADQAVIAIENVRLFTELEARTTELTRSVEELRALGEVGRALSSTLDLPTVLDTILARANVLAGTDGGVIYEFTAREQRFDLLRATDSFDAEFMTALRTTPLVYGEGAVGRAAELREPVQIPDVGDSVAYSSRVREAVLRAGYRALLAVPLLAEDEVVGALVVNRRAPGAFEPRVVDVLRTFGTQSALAIQNARLFREIEDKSRQLEAANRHKDEFLASMSHELRTPLNAVIGFSEVLLERMFGDVNDKQEEYLRDILASGRHLLSLINDILDLAKIEAGRMELDVEEFDVAQAIDNAVVLVRERATRKGLTLVTTLAPGLGSIRGDQRKVKQVLLNLLSNAVKFTPEGGQVEVRAHRAGGEVEIAVVDTGIGIAPEDQEAVFEEFRQVGTDYAKKHEGTGLGLTLSRKFVELHGGRIWVKSQLGQGSTFAFSLPGGPWPTS